MYIYFSFRFRVTSATNDLAPWKVSVEGHRLAMISADGMSFEEFYADTFSVYPGKPHCYLLISNKRKQCKQAVRRLLTCDNKTLGLLSTD